MLLETAVDKCKFLCCLLYQNARMLGEIVGDVQIDHPQSGPA